MVTIAVNADKPDRWKRDIAASVDFYNDWFMRFAPKAYRDTRTQTAQQVEQALRHTANLRDVSADALMAHPAALRVLRMATAPPIARDRLVGLAKVSHTLVQCMEEDGRVPPRMSRDRLKEQLSRIGDTVTALADKDLLPWLENAHAPTQEEIVRAATVIADRLCGSLSDPIIRNAQERRQLSTIGEWLKERGYVDVTGQGLSLDELKPGSFAFRLNIPARLSRDRWVNVPVDAAIKAMSSRVGELPLLVEAKSAGDFTNTNKRRKEEATKVGQLRNTYGPDLRFILFLCGYFDSGYLGYEAAEGIDWVWEHRIDDLAEFGV